MWRIADPFLYSAALAMSPAQSYGLRPNARAAARYAHMKATGFWPKADAAGHWIEVAPRKGRLFWARKQRLRWVPVK